MNTIAEICRGYDDRMIVELFAMAVAWREDPKMAPASLGAIKEILNRGHGRIPQRIEGEGMDALAKLAQLLTVPESEQPADVDEGEGDEGEGEAEE